METDDNGKLYLPEVDNFFFSLSHSGEYAACVVCDVPVGVDIQKKRMTKANIAKRFFQIKESDKIEKQPPEKRDDMFFRYWTGKESYLKLTGKGILGGLDSFFVDLEEKKITIPFNRTDLANYLDADRSALTRELSRMRQEGLIDFEKNTFVLLGQ